MYFCTGAYSSSGMRRKVVGSDKAEALTILSEMSINWTKAGSKIARLDSHQTDLKICKVILTLKLSKENKKLE